jgi:glycosyltransferase involved in cell wall biosynthesis
LTKIALTRLSPIVNDPRVFKIVKSLKKRYSILALGWNRENVHSNIVDNYLTDLKLCKLGAPLGKSLIHSPKMLISYVYFWVWLFIELIKARPDIVHSCDLDTAVPCYLYKLFFKKKLVFDIFDRYAMAFVPSKNKLYYSVVNFLEEFLSKRSDVLINVSNEALNTFRKKPKCCVTIMNCPEDYGIHKDRSKDDIILTVVYTGAILRKLHGLLNVVAAIKDVANVELVLAGWYLNSDKEFLDEILQFPNVKYRGLLQPKDAWALEASADVMIALYDPELLWYNIMLPNKLFEAMMCGIPLVTNIAPDIVDEVGFGIIVQYHNVRQIKEAILTLRDSASLRKRLGLNGRKAFIEKYNWLKMEDKLFKVYENLSQKE